MDDLFEKTQQAVYQMRLARQQIDMHTWEAGQIDVQAKPYRHFLRSEILLNKLPAEFAIFLPGWLPESWLDERAGKILIQFVKRGLEKIVWTASGWMHPTLAGYKRCTTIGPEITTKAVKKFCHNFYLKYGMEVEIIEHSITPTPGKIEGKPNA